MAIPRYDGIQTAYQLGGDLQVGSIAGDANVDRPVDYPWHAPGFDTQAHDFGPAGPNVSIIEHAGSLFVAWVETQWDGHSEWEDDPQSRYRVLHDNGISGTHLPLYLSNGPYVKRYDPGSSSWVIMGDPIEPTLTQVNGDVMAISYSAFEVPPPSYPVGSRFLPTRPRLASDGTNLFLVYAIHLMVDDYVDPLFAYVRRWNGSGWETWGQIDAVGQNDIQFTFFGDNPSVFSGLTASASPDDPGAVYVTLVNAGRFAGVYTYQGVAVRFDGTSLGGTLEVLGVGPSHSPNITSPSTLFATTVTRFDDANGDMIFWTDAHLDEYNLQRWPATIEQVMVAFDPFSSGVPGLVRSVGPLGYDAGVWYVLYESTGLLTYVYELLSDGSTGTVDLLDGLPVLGWSFGPPGSPITHNGSPPVGIASLMPEPPENIWGVSIMEGSRSFPGEQGNIWSYHRPCRAWTKQSFTATPNGETPSGAPLADSFVLDGNRTTVAPTKLRNRVGGFDQGMGPADIYPILVDDVIYVAAWLKDSYTEKMKLRVYACPIERDKNVCPSAGGARAIHIYDHFTVVP